PPRPRSVATVFPYTTLFRSGHGGDAEQHEAHVADGGVGDQTLEVAVGAALGEGEAGEGTVDDADDGEGRQVRGEGAEAVGCGREDRKSTRLNSSHVKSSYAV